MKPAPRSIESFQREYRQRTGWHAVWVDAHGRLSKSLGTPPPQETCPCGWDPAIRELRRLAVTEAERFGEPCLVTCPHGHLLWAIPLHDNNRLGGGLVAIGPRFEGEGAEAAVNTAQLREQAALLGELAIAQNWVNTAHLAANRLTAAGHRVRAEAIHEWKDHPCASIVEVYLREEPELLTAIKRGDRAAARQRLNHVLLAIYHLAGDRLELLKSFALELVVMMSRAAVVCGAEPTEVLGARYRWLTGLEGVRDEESLSQWLTGMLEHLIDTIGATSKYPVTVLLARARQYMEEHLSEDLTRDQVARAVGLSPGHFSHLVSQHFGRPFRDLLYDLRVARARQLIVQTGKTLAAIAQECGFCDQSHFHKHFRRRYAMTPRQYRKPSS